MNNKPYNERLSEYPNKGVCGLPENEDSARSLTYKVAKLIKLMQNATHIVVLTGAGISTNAGIKDFRGPSGIWTAEETARKKARKENSRKRRRKGVEHQTSDQNEDADCLESMKNDPENTTKAQVTDHSNSSNLQQSFISAIPTITHRSITRLVQLGIIKHVVTQNVDGLHIRSGLPRSKLSVLHGCLFTEKCSECAAEYFRDFDVGGVSFQKTGRKCEKNNCEGDLHDTILDWNDELPDIDWAISQEQCQHSDLILAVGTSLRIEPAGNLPTLGKQFVIINKQVTPYDSKAALIIRADVDDIFSKIMEQFDLNK